jgi:hypothetical protein
MTVKFLRLWWAVYVVWAVQIGNVQNILVKNQLTVCEDYRQMTPAQNHIFLAVPNHQVLPIVSWLFIQLHYVIRVMLSKDNIYQDMNVIKLL